MASTRSSRAADRRAQQAAEGRTERRIYLAAAAIGGIVLALVVAGVILTVVLPPRSTVVKVGDRTFTARDLAVRVKYAALIEQNGSAATDPSVVIPALTRAEVIRQKSEELGVSSVTDEELNKVLRKKLSAAPDMPEADFQTGYQRYLKTIPVTRDQYESIVSGEALGQKAADSLKAKIPEAGPQVHLLGVPVSDRQKAEDLRTAVKSGKDFAQEAVSRGLAQPEQIDLQWHDPASLPDLVKAIGDLKAGEVSEVIADDQAGGFFVAFMLEREENRKYDDAVKAEIANRQLLDWVKQQEASLVGPTTLSKSAESWVIRQVKSAIADATRRSQEAQRTTK